MILSVNKIINLQKRLGINWHKKNLEYLNEAKQIHKNSFYELIEANHRHNFNLWHLEDRARERRISDSNIANIKRKIDKENQRRNDSIEKIDEWFSSRLKKNRRRLAKNPLIHTETVGSVIDRLSVLNLKINHMQIEAKRKDSSREHRLLAKKRLRILNLQYKDLIYAFKILLKEIEEGRKNHKMYYQFKMYNDPDFNPRIYKNVKKNRQ